MNEMDYKERLAFMEGKIEAYKDMEKYFEKLKWADAQEFDNE